MFSNGIKLTDEDEVPQLNPILSKHHNKSDKNIQIEQLLNRLLQEMDDENNDIEKLNKIFANLSVKSGIDYNLWKLKKGLPSLEKGTFSTVSITSSDEMDTSPDTDSSNDLLQSIIKQRNNAKKNVNSNVPIDNYNEFDDDDDIIRKNKERTLLLCLLHREKKLKAHYESVLASYKDIFTYLIYATKSRREETYGVYTDFQKSKKQKSLSINSKTASSMKPIEAIQISKSLKNRDDTFKKNTEFLKSLANNKRMEIELTKKALIEESSIINDILSQLDESINDNNTTNEVKVDN